MGFKYALNLSMDLILTTHLISPDFKCLLNLSMDLSTILNFKYGLKFDQALHSERIPNFKSVLKYELS
jgi:hypothetical protein